MGEALKIGLHSQTLNGQVGVISGSEVTTNGLANALKKHEDKHQVFRFAPRNYDFVSVSKLDLVIIEGWHFELPQFIASVRKLYPLAKIIFWNLSFYGFNGVIRLDVDGYLTNSKKNSLLLNRVKPTKFLMLAADIDLFNFNKSADCSNNNISYLGMYHPSKSEIVERRILHEAAEFNLQIYGYGWENHASLKKYAKGVLPLHQIGDLYHSSLAVLGITEDRQRQFGMINNRVFEALACGACFISEHFDELEQTFGDLIFYSKDTGDTKKAIEMLLNNQNNLKEYRHSGISFIKENHTYQHRINDILDFYQSLLRH